MAEREMPTGVKIISILYYIKAPINLVFGPTLTLSSVYSGSVGAFVFGIVLFCLGGLDIFIGRGLWKGKNWARIAAIVLAILGIIGGIGLLIFFLKMKVITPWAFGRELFLFLSFVQLAVSLLIGGYLALAHEVKEAFA